MVEMLPKARAGIPLVLPHALLAFGLLLFAVVSERGAQAGPGRPQDPPFGAPSAAAAPALVPAAPHATIALAALGRI